MYNNRYYSKAIWSDAYTGHNFSSKNQDPKQIDIFGLKSDNF